MFSRIANLFKGFLSLFISGIEKRNPEALLEVEKENLRKQIAGAEVVIGLSSLYDAQRELVTFQLMYAQASHKPVVLVRPFGARKDVPKELTDLANEVVDWDERALVDAIRRQARHEDTNRWETIEFKLD